MDVSVCYRSVSGNIPFWISQSIFYPWLNSFLLSQVPAEDLSLDVLVTSFSRTFPDRSPRNTSTCPRFLWFPLPQMHLGYPATLISLTPSPCLLGRYIESNSPSQRWHRRKRGMRCWRIRSGWGNDTRGEESPATASYVWWTAGPTRVLIECWDREA